MKLAPLRIQHGVLSALLAGLFLAWGVWSLRVPAPAEPLPWLVAWQHNVLPMLADGQLTLGELRGADARHAEGELLLRSRPDGVQLLYRAAIGDAGGAWALLAELELGARDRASVVSAADLQAGAGETQLSRQWLEQLAHLPVHELELTPASTLAVERLASSLGQPRLRLQLEDGEVWVYPQLGLMARERDGALLQLRGMPKRAMQH